MNGLKIQWAEVTTGNDVSQTFDFSTLGLLSFTSADSYKVMLTQIRTTENQYNANLYLISKTASSIKIRGQSDKCSFIAIGY